MNLPRVDLLVILAGVFLNYAVESYFSCRRLEAFEIRSRGFYGWDSCLIVLSLLAVVALQSVSPTFEERSLVILTAVLGGQIGNALVIEFRKN